MAENPEDNIVTDEDIINKAMEEGSNNDNVNVVVSSTGIHVK